MMILQDGGEDLPIFFYVETLEPPLLFPFNSDFR